VGAAPIAISALQAVVNTVQVLSSPSSPSSTIRRRVCRWGAAVPIDGELAKHLEQQRAGIKSIAYQPTGVIMEVTPR